MFGGEHRAVSAMNEYNVSRVDRPYGTSAVVWRSSLELAFQPVGTTSTRLCAVVSRNHSIRLLIISVCMANTHNCDLTFDVLVVLNKMSAVINFFNRYDIVIGGISV